MQILKNSFLLFCIILIACTEKKSESIECEENSCFIKNFEFYSVQLKYDSWREEFLEYVIIQKGKRLSIMKLDSDGRIVSIYSKQINSGVDPSIYMNFDSTGNFVNVRNFKDSIEYDFDSKMKETLDIIKFAPLPEKKESY